MIKGATKVRDCVIKKEQIKAESVTQSEVIAKTLHQIKFAAATKRAEELLDQSITLSIQDSLNCGKFNARYAKELLFVLKSILGFNQK